MNAGGSAREAEAYPGGQAYRRRRRVELLRFAQGARVAEGFGYLDDAGEVDPGRPVELYVTCRMTHVFGLGLMAGEEPAPGGPTEGELTDLVTHGVSVLLDGPLRDAEHGGWFASVRDGAVDVATKQAYAHAFVVLAASTARTAGIPRADELLEAALAVQESRFWDEQQGMVVEEWDASWTDLDPYRGINSAMHTVEAYLAAWAAGAGPRWRERALRIAARVVDWAAERSWRIPEHFDTDWTPLPEHNKDRPAHPFRPYGATVGHGLEWSRLLVTLATTGDEVDADLLEAGIRLADRAVTDGWAADGQDGFVYTTDWEGTPVVRERMHWVLTEAIATSTVLHQVTGRAAHAVDLERWWAYADRYLVDPEGLSWRHELDQDNRPSARTWPGRPDAYHAYQAALVADVPGAASFARGVASWAG